VIKLVADVMVLSRGEVLLVRYADSAKYDDETGWFLPDDFLRRGEHPDAAARRILADQAGIVDADPALDHVESFGGEAGEAWHLVFHIRANAVLARVPFAAPALAEARWFPLSALPDRASVAHGGWALDLIAHMTRSPGSG
jgi:ADP-ribose pyrophosphatase YjhB (NUDIX family)